MCVRRERRRVFPPPSLLLKLKLCYHSSTLPTHSCQPVGNRLSFWPSDSDEVLALSISCFQSLKRVCAPCIIYSRSLFVYCTKIVFVVFSYFFLFFFYISFIFIIIILLYILLFLPPRPSYRALHSPPPSLQPPVKSRSSSRFYLFISIFLFLLYVFCITKKSTFHFWASTYVVCVRLRGNMNNCLGLY